MLGTILITENRSHLESTLGAKGVPQSVADDIADRSAPARPPAAAKRPRQAGPKPKPSNTVINSAIAHDFALASRTVFYVMAGVMAVAFVVALLKMPSGKVEEEIEEPAAPVSGPA